MNQRGREQQERRLGDYRLLNLLGQHDGSEVYLAEHIYKHIQVAIKLQPGRRTGQDEQRFLKQASALTRLSHPHIIPVLDYGVENGQTYLVMSYAARGTLRERHPRGTHLEPEVVVSYVKQVASALQYVHYHQLVHRDIKPHNMLVGENDKILLSDFGTAVVSTSIHLYEHDFEGTVLYTAPEQLQGKPRRASDQYALGIVVYEWLTGDWPFNGTFEEIAHQHLFIAPPALHARGVQIAPQVERVVLRALEKEAEKRYPNITEFARALEKASQAAPQPPQQPEKKQFKTPRPFGEKST